MRNALVLLNKNGNPSPNAVSSTAPAPNGYAPAGGNPFTAGNFAAISQQMMGPGYGFRLRPFIDPTNFLTVQNPTPASYKFAQPQCPNIPGAFPIFARVLFENAADESFLYITDDRLHYFGGRRFTRVDLYYSVSLTPQWAFMASSLSVYFLATVLEAPEEWTDLPSQEAPNIINVELLVTGATSFFLFAQSAYPSLAAAPVPVQPINAFGFNDSMTVDGASQRVGAFYVFPQYKRFKTVLTAAGGPQDILILKAPARGGNLGFTAVERILAGAWLDDGAGNASLTIERDLTFRDEWVLLAATSAGLNDVKVQFLHLYFNN